MFCLLANECNVKLMEILVAKEVCTASSFNYQQQYSNWQESFKLLSSATQKTTIYLLMMSIHTVRDHFLNKKYA